MELPAGEFFMKPFGERGRDFDLAGYGNRGRAREQCAGGSSLQRK